jgi:hypothetical protein
MKHYRQKHGFSRWSGTLDELEAYFTRLREEEKKYEEFCKREGHTDTVTPW